MNSYPLTPFPNSFWVIPRRFLAGEYPALLDPERNRVQIRGLLAAQAKVFINLTEIAETEDLFSYQAIIRTLDLKYAQECTFARFPIVDMEIPTIAVMKEILDTIDAAMAAQQTVYLHCWGGIGRTGTVIGCYLVRHGMDGQQAIDALARLRANTPDWRYPAPSREAQSQMVLNWVNNQ